MFVMDFVWAVEVSINFSAESTLQTFKIEHQM